LYHRCCGHYTGSCAIIVFFVFNHHGNEFHKCAPTNINTFRINIAQHVGLFALIVIVVISKHFRGDFCKIITRNCPLIPGNSETWRPCLLFVNYTHRAFNSQEFNIKPRQLTASLSRVRWNEKMINLEISRRLDSLCNY